MGRRLAVLLVVVGLVVGLGGGFLWALPEILRRTVVTQFPKLTGRALSLEDIDLNLFTGRLVLTKLRIAERDPSETFVQAERIALRLVPFSLITGHLVLDEVSFTAPRVRVVRTGPREFNFSDLLTSSAPVDPNEPKGEWTLTIARLALIDGALLVVDRAVSPARDWQVRGLTVEVEGLTTRAGRPPGHLAVRASVNDAPFSASAKAVVLTPVGLTLDVALDRFDLTQVRPYLPPGLPASLESGRLGLALQLAVERGETSLTRAAVTGDVRVEDLALALPDHPVPFVKLPRLSVAIRLADLLASAVTLGSVEAEGLDLRMMRDRAGAIDLLALAGKPPAEAAQEEARARAPAPNAATATATPVWKVKLERLAVRSGTVAFDDQAVSPAREWQLSGLAIDGAGFSTSPDDGPATLKLSGQLGATPGRPATIAAEIGSLRLSPLAATASVTLAGFDLGALGPYWPAALPAVVRDGALDVKATAAVERNDTELTRAVASASVGLAGLTLIRRGVSSAPFLTVPKLLVEVKQADAIARTVDVRSVAMEGVDARAGRDPRGQIDLLEMIDAVTAEVPAPAPPAAPPAAGTAPSPPEWKITLDRFDFTKGTATFEDRAVSPTAVLAAKDLTVNAQRMAWPSTTPATFTGSLTMPGGGRSDVKGRVRLEPLDVQIAIATRDAPILPFQAYFPFPARFVGFFSGDSLSEIQRLKDGTLVIASRGDAWARDFEVRAPGTDTAVARLARMEIQGIDFSWPNYALIKRIVFTKPEAQVERDADGVINLPRLFAPERPQTPKAPTAEPPAKPKPAAKQNSEGGGLLQEMVLSCDEITSVDGYVRFLDRTTTPAFSTDLSDFTVTIRGASNQVGRPISMTTHAKVGGDGTLEMKGQVSGTGEGFRADLGGDLKDFALPTANPYVEKLTSWLITKGKFSLRTHYRIEGDRLDAEHDMLFAGLRVERSRGPDEGRQRLGVPLGLAVALLKDRHGNIDFSIPLHGTLSDRQFAWSDAMWAGARQVIVKLIVSPFNLIGRAFTGGQDTVEKLEVEPVTFAPASVVIAAPMEVHLTRVADFLRRAPSLVLTLTPAVSAADVDALKTRVVKDRLESLERERGLTDLAEAIKAYAGERLPGVTLPEKVEEQLALLGSREPLPEGPIGDLLKGRVDATRDRLVKVEGIPAERLTVAFPSPADAVAAASGEGRVDFGLGAADQ